LRYGAIALLDPRDFGKVPLGDALLEAVSKEACEVAAQFLTMCIRAIDYCPPVDMLLGEYLRALVTADAEMEPVDKWGYREALMRSFRRRRIFPTDVQFMTEDAVRWGAPEEPLTIPGLAFRDLRFEGDPGRPANAKELERQANILGRFVTDPYSDVDLKAHAEVISPAKVAATVKRAVALVRTEGSRLAFTRGKKGAIAFYVNGDREDLSGKAALLAQELANRMVVPAETVRPYMSDKKCQGLLASLLSTGALVVEE
jgi:hypothetical protein